MATTGYAAAIDTGDLIMSYGVEAVWGTAPAAGFQQIRLNGEGFSSNKSRVRPAEINSSGQASASLTTKQESSGSLEFSVSAGTHNALLAASIGTEFPTVSQAGSGLVNMTATTIACSAVDTLTDSGNGFLTAGAVAGMWIKVSGFTGAGATANAGFFQIQTVVAGSMTVLPATLVVDAAGEPVTLKGCMCRNGTIFQSFYFQKMLKAYSDAFPGTNGIFLRYPGSWPTGGSLDVGVGDYLKGTLSFLNKDETAAVADAGSVAPTAAPTGTVVDSVSGVSNVLRNNAAVVALVQKIGIKWTKEGARGQFAIGSSAAAGIGKGTLTISGLLSTYFKDMILYTEFKNETSGPLSFRALDSMGKGYIFTICNAAVMNPKVVASQPNSDIMADFELEGNPGATLYGGKTMQIDYFS